MIKIILSLILLLCSTIISEADMLVGTKPLAYPTSADDLSVSGNLEVSGNIYNNGGIIQKVLTPVSIKTSAYNANAGELVPVDLSGGSFTVTLPSAPAEGTQIEVIIVTTSTTGVVAVACSGSDTFQKPTGSTTLYMNLQTEDVILQYSASTKVWYVMPMASPSSTNVQSAIEELTTEKLSIDGVIYNTGINIGIGSTAPQQKLEVDGNVYIQGISGKVKMQSPDGKLWSCQPVNSTGVFMCS